MATVNSPVTERRHLPDRRSNSSPDATRPMGIADWIPLVILAVGGINWGLIGLFNFNLVSALFGDMSALSRLVYVLVGLSALYTLYLGARMSRRQP